jgi:signal transduction histidine kinase
VNYIFIGIAFFLLLLGMYPFARRKSPLTVVFMIVNTSLAVWNLCFFLQQENLYFLGVNLVSQIQLECGLIFSSGFYLLSYLYPAHSRKINHYLAFAAVIAFVAFSMAIFATDFVSRAELVNGELVFVDGPGYAVYALYTLMIALLCMRNLYLTYKRQPEHRIGVILIAVAIAAFALLGVIFAFALPLLGNFNFLDYSTLGAIFPLMMFAYAITKHDFLDMSVIINKSMSWTLTLLIVVGSFSPVYLSTLNTHPILGWLATGALGVFWAFFAIPLQRFLLTTAKRKFIRGWYDIEEVLNQLSEKVTTEKNRRSIFTTIEKAVDNVLQLEKTNVVMAVRDQSEQLSHYEMLTTGDARPALSLMVNHPLIMNFGSDKVLQFLEECDAQSREFLLSHGYKEGKRCLIIAFHSPEFLEGLVILGERSNQSVFDANDLRFFRRLANYMSAIFYRLTPMEKLQKSYFENVQRLHEAEIQLIRAQKIESIVHATRQCHHEIRTPLNIIRMGLGRVKDLEGLKTYKAMVDEEIAHALEIVDETLLITDVEKPAANREAVFNLNDAIRRSLKLIQEDRYEVHASLEGDIPVKGIFSDIQVVFANLIHNSADAMPAGGSFTVQSRIVDNLAVVEFSDTGKGIAEELRERVWEPYFSGHATAVGNSTAGRGWGLTIVNRIVSEHKGTINFTSIIGEGTTFIIKLPLIIASAKDSALEVYHDH